MSKNRTVPRIHSEFRHLGNRCIWCGSHASSPDVEHIIPESMGGPWVLPGNVVCGQCNARLSRLDRALSDPFDFVTFAKGIIGKKGRRKKVRSRGNLVAEHDAQGHPVIRVNPSSASVRLPDGTVLSGMGGSARNVSSTVRHLDGGYVFVNLGAPLIFDRSATRGIVKIAFETLAWWIGAAPLLDSKYDAVRDYVIHDRGARRVLMFLPSEDRGSYRHDLYPPLGDGVACFRLAIVEFLVDLTPDRATMPDVEKDAHERWGDHGWHVIPDKI